MSCCGKKGLRIIIGVLNILLSIYGFAVLVPIIMIMTMGDSNVNKEINLENVNAVGFAIGFFAVLGSVFFAMIWCFPCISDTLARILVIVYCIVWVLKIALEIAFLIQISQVQSTLEETIEKFLVRNVLKAGGIEAKDMNYEKFDKLPPFEKEAGNVSCGSSCKASIELMDIIQKKFECCGIKKAEDWDKVAPKLPQSCCADKNCKIVHKHDCMSDMHKMINKTFTWMFYVMIIAIFIQVVCILFAVLLYKVMKEKQ